MINNKTNNPFIKIGKLYIGPDYKPIIICELGINHNGSLKEAIKIVDAAKKSGAQIIKHQTHVPNDEMSEEAKNIIPGNSKKSIYKIMHDCALNEKDEFKLMKYVEKKKMMFISTPFSRAAVDRLIRFKVKAFKIGSGECNNYPLIKYICSFGKPLIVSTGMNNIKQITKTTKILEKFKINFALLHTTNLYPTPHRLVRLGAMRELMNKFKGRVIGLSDHTTDNFSSYFALGMGASIIEKHFTDTKKRKGPDISCSMDPSDLKDMIKAVNLFEKMKGGKKIPAKEELITSNFAFASVVCTKNIIKGERLNQQNIWIKRPGNGYFSSNDYEKLIGKYAKKNIYEGHQLKKYDV